MTDKDRHELIKAACEDCRKGILSKDAALNIVEWLASEPKSITDDQRAWAIRVEAEEKARLNNFEFPLLGSNSLG